MAVVPGHLDYRQSIHSSCQPLILAGQITSSPRTPIALLAATRTVLRQIDCHPQQKDLYPTFRVNNLHRIIRKLDIVANTYPTVRYIYISVDETKLDDDVLARCRLKVI